MNSITQPLVYIVILNNNHRDDTLACLRSLSQNTYTNITLVVLDNNSSDDSVEAIRSTYPDSQIIILTENLGYAGNNNIGMEEAVKQGADWILVLNEDTIVDQGCIMNLVSVGESDPKIGIIGPMVYHHDEPGVIQSAGGMLGKYWQSQHLGKNEKDTGQFESSHAVEWVSGCAIMIRREVIEQIGMFDTEYFLYWEETEFCIRAREGGWKIVNAPKAKLWHKGVRRDYQPSPYVTYYLTRNHLLTLKKHNAPVWVKFYTWLQYWRTLISWSVRPKWQYMYEHRNAMWRGMVDFFWRRWGQMTNVDR